MGLIKPCISLKLLTLWIKTLFWSRFEVWTNDLKGLSHPLEDLFTDQYVENTSMYVACIGFVARTGFETRILLSVST